MQNKKLKKVLPQDLAQNMNALMLAAKEGRLYVDTERKEVSRTQVINDVRTYVSQIKWLATREWQSAIDDVWEELFSTEEFVGMLMPGKKTRKFRKFNKYGVMRIVGVLRSHNVYDECINDSRLCFELEHTEGDNAYRSYIGMGFEERQMLKKMSEILGKRRI